ncbi:hypothetical protein [Gemmiger sp.]|uniref:hypothetical protein n=1 Tax=Gemmiger sp. TaxID=2049027 RepID=UPI0025BE10A0|nr:hypothetical protein [Gemmiger sp.]
MSNEELEVGLGIIFYSLAAVFTISVGNGLDHSGSKIVSVIFFPIQKSPRPQLVFGTGCGRGVFILGNTA